jgi:hypothetical protein
MNIDTAVYLLSIYIKSSIHVHIDSEQEEKALLYSVCLVYACRLTRPCLPNACIASDDLEEFHISFYIIVDL